MEHLRKIGLICRTHYEKIILSLVLLGLAVAVWYLNGQRQQENLNVKIDVEKIIKKKVQGVPPENVTNFFVAFARIERPAPFELTPPHNLFNPVEWQTNRASGAIRRIRSEEDIGPEKLELLNTEPLTLSIGFGRPIGSGDNVTAYQLPITNQTLRRPAIYPIPVVNVAVTNDKVPFILREIRGPPGAPEEMVIELKDSAEKVTITPAKPFVRIEAYKADLRYPLERNSVFNNKRVGDALHFAGKDYKIVEIKQNEVVVVSPKNKPTTVRKKSAP